MLIKSFRQKKEKKPKFKLGDLIRSADNKIFLMKVIQEINLISCTKLQKLFNGTIPTNPRNTLLAKYN